MRLCSAMRKKRVLFILLISWAVYGQAVVPGGGGISGVEQSWNFGRIVFRATARKLLGTSILLVPGETLEQLVDAGESPSEPVYTNESLSGKPESAQEETHVCRSWDLVWELLRGALPPKCAMMEDLLISIPGKKMNDATKGNDKIWPKFRASARMVLATVLGFFGAALANAGGVGGGGLFVPMFNLLLGFDAKTSAALSKAMVLGGSLASFAFNVQLRNPMGDSSSLINYDIALLLTPFLVLGISIGVTLNVIFPGWLIILLLTIFLTYTTYGVTRQGFKTYAQETELHHRAQAQQAEQVTAQRASESAADGREGDQGNDDYHELPDDTDGGHTKTPDKAFPTLSNSLGLNFNFASKRSKSEANLVGRGPGRATGGGGEGEGAPFASSYNSLFDISEEERLLYPTYVSTHEVGVHLLDLDEVEGVGRGQHPNSPRARVPPASPRSPRSAQGPRRKMTMVERFHMGEPLDKPFWQLIDWKSLVQLIVIWFAFFSIQIAKTHSALCGRLYWLLNLSQIPVAVLATVSGATQMLHKQREQAELDRLVSAPTSSGEVRWSPRQVSTYPFFALLAGTCGGLLGIGGGMVLGPALLALKIHPQVSSSTTSFMVIFSAAMSVTEFYLLGRIPINFAIYFSILCMASAFFGLSLVRALVVRSGHASIIIFVLAAVIGISGLVIGSLGTANSIAAFLAGEYMGFHSPCTA